LCRIVGIEIEGGNMERSKDERGKFRSAKWIVEK